MITVNELSVTLINTWKKKYVQNEWWAIPDSNWRPLGFVFYAI